MRNLSVVLHSVYAVNADISDVQCCLADLVKSHHPVAEWSRVKQQASKYSHVDL